MKQEVLAFFHMPQLSIMGLWIFLVFFMLMLGWVFSRYRRPLYQHLADLPLGEDT